MRTAEMLAIKSGGILGTEHLLCAFTYHENCHAAKILARHGIDKSISKVFLKSDGTSYVTVEYSQRMLNCQQTAIRLCNKIGIRLVNSLILLIASLEDRSSYAFNNLLRMGISPEDIGNDAFDALNALIMKARSNAQKPRSESEKAQFGGEEYGGEDEDILAGLGEDMTQKAKAGKLDPVIGRDEEIQRIIEILSRRKKNNPILIGEPGVGKSAVVEGLAQAIIEGKVPEQLKNKRVFSLDMASLLAGTKYRGEFEERLKKAIEQLNKRGDTILF
ncbi:MAG: AAA family ATPase, partial [Clostridia bacterium]|nr:AAA family ATPase [Clostridia bacterium]